jgi:hypothetical protein
MRQEAMADRWRSRTNVEAGAEEEAEEVPQAPVALAATVARSVAVEGAVVPAEMV